MDLFYLSTAEWQAVRLSVWVSVVAVAASLPAGVALGWLAHLGVGTKRPVGRNSRVRISATKETITACAGLTTMEA